MIYEITGSLLDSDCQYICHQVNCQGAMNSGVAKAIRTKWPQVYSAYRSNIQDLGTVQFVALNGGQWIVNMFAQDQYGYDRLRYTSYDAFWLCLGALAQAIPKGSSIAFPSRIGSCRGGANWNVIKTMIEQVLGADYNVFIYEYKEES